MNKAELTEALKVQGVEAPHGATKSKLEEMFAANTGPAAGNAVAGLTRRRINRGSTRRIMKAVTAFDKGMEAFIKEIDLQFYEADDKGERVREWDMVKSLRLMRQGVIEEINQQLHPADKAE